MKRLVIIPIFCLSLFACDGGGDDKPKQIGVPGVSGSVCLQSGSGVHIEVEGESSRDISIEGNVLAPLYQGNIGGQIRAIEKINVASPGQESNEAFAWGSGSSIVFGTNKKFLGKVAFKKTGAVTDLAAIHVDDVPNLVYSTEKGIGLIGIKSDGVLVESAYRPMSSTVLSISANADGSKIAFVTGDGYLQMTSASELLENKSCTKVFSAASVLKSSDKNYYPAKVRLGESKAFVLAKISRGTSFVAPTLEDIFNPIFDAMVNDTIPSIVRAVNIDDRYVFEVGFDTTDESSKFFDGFIPTDISYDGANLHVVGLAYKKSLVQEFLTGNCPATDASAKINCLREKAMDGTLTTYSKEGLYAVSGGFYSYNNISDLSKASHFTLIPLATFRKITKAPPYTYAITIDGDRGFVRGPNFLLSMTKSAEKWTIDREIDATGGFTGGIPNDLTIYAAGVASAETSVMSSDGTGASGADYLDAAGTFWLLDTGAIYVRADSAASTGLLAAIEMKSSRGGDLYLENLASRTPITDFTYPNVFVSNAAYNGTQLAFIWSSTGSDDTKEMTQGVRIAMQDGASKSARGELFINRTSDQWHFKNFPELKISDSEPWSIRGVVDIAIGADKIVALYAGVSGGKWYHQLGLYGYRKESDKYKIELEGITETFFRTGITGGHKGKILKIAKEAGVYKIHFSASDGVYLWGVTPADSSSMTTTVANKVFSSSEIVDAAIDATNSDKLALVMGNKIMIKNFSNLAGGTLISVPLKDVSVQVLTNSKIALAGNSTVIATPNGAAAPFYIYNGNTPTACSTCNFQDVSIFSSFPDYMITSSVGSGLEVYSVKK